MRGRSTEVVVIWLPNQVRRSDSREYLVWTQSLHTFQISVKRNEHIRDRQHLTLALAQAEESLAEGGVPVGALLSKGDELVSLGHNNRVQNGDPTAHGEIDCIRKAGRRDDYKDLTLYTTLSPCAMCAGAIIQFKIGRVVIGDNINFGGNENMMRENGIQIDIVNSNDCVEMMRKFISSEPELWNEDIAS